MGEDECGKDVLEPVEGRCEERGEGAESQQSQEERGEGGRGRHLFRRCADQLLAQQVEDRRRIVGQLVEVQHLVDQKRQRVSRVGVRVERSRNLLQLSPRIPHQSQDQVPLCTSPLSSPTPAVIGGIIGGWEGWIGGWEGWIRG